MINRLTPLRPVLSASEVRCHLRLVDDSESDLLESYLLAAMEEIEHQCERALCAAQYSLTLPAWPVYSSAISGPLPFAENDPYRSVSGQLVELHRPPVRKITSLQYYDASNQSQTLDSDEYQLLTITEPSELRPAADTNWPSVKNRRDAITITFWAGHVIPIAVASYNDDTLTSLTGYPFANGDSFVISKSGNTNSLVGDVSVFPGGISERTTVYVVNASGSQFQIALSAGGSAISLVAPTASGEAVDLLFAYELDHWQRRALLMMAGKAFAMRCPQGGCVCSADDFQSDPILRRMKWRENVTFAG